MTGDRLPAPVTVRIACDGWAEPRHDIVIDVDWSVRTPHDMTADRVIAALGGAAHSCLEIDSAARVAKIAYETRTRHRDRARRKRASADRRPRSPISESWLARSVEIRHRTGSTSIAAQEIAAELIRRFGDDCPTAAQIEAARALLVEPCGVDILWDHGVHPRTFVEWATTGRRLPRPVSAFAAVDAILTGRDDPLPAAPAARDGEPSPVQPLTADHDGAPVLPGLLTTILADPELARQLVNTARRPSHDHSPDSAVPGCARFLDAELSRRAVDAVRGNFDAFRDAHRSGPLRVRFESVDGTAVGVLGRGAHSLLRGDAIAFPLVPEAPAEPLPRSPDIPGDLCYTVAAEMYAKHLTPARRHSAARVAQALLYAGRYSDAIEWMLQLSPHSRPIRSKIGIQTTLLVMALSGCFVSPQREAIIALATENLLREAPELWGLPIDCRGHRDLDAGSAEHLDLDAVAGLTSDWLREIARAMSPVDDGAALLEAIAVHRRPHDIACTWGPATATLQYQREGRAVPRWHAVGDDDARTRILGVALVLAFSEHTGIQAFVGWHPRDLDAATNREAIVRSLFQVRELQRLVVPVLR